MTEPTRTGLIAWIKSHLQKALEIDDTPKAVAIGVAVGIFFGFTPLFGLKTLLAIGMTWALRGNKIAAAIAVTSHDLLLPIIPVILRIEYDIGYWILSDPHVLPPHLHVHHSVAFGTWLHWSTFLTTGRPVLLGSLVFATPFTIVAYIVVKKILHRRKSTALIAKEPKNPVGDR